MKKLNRKFFITFFISLIIASFLMGTLGGIFYKAGPGLIYFGIMGLVVSLTYGERLEICGIKF